MLMKFNMYSTNIKRVTSITHLHLTKYLLKRGTQYQCSKPQKHYILSSLNQIRAQNASLISFNQSIGEKETTLQLGLLKKL